MTATRRFTACALACVLWAAPVARASAGTRVVFTIDVESTDTLPLPDQVDAVCAERTACGLMEISRLIAARGWSATFFLNVYEQRQWGEAAVRNIAVRLQEAGQDVALHTHPQWAYDPARWAMYQYTLEEQTTIVRDGARMLESWTGRPVVAHRAGAYAADERTLEALQRNGVLLDSSMFWKEPNSRLNQLGLPRNLPSHHDHVAQIPVTVYERDDRPSVLPGLFAPVTTVRKIDPDWFIDADEMRAAVDGVVDADIPVMVVFLHSFSFLTDQRSGDGRLANHHSITLFRDLLDHIARKGLPASTMRDLALAPPESIASIASDIVPRVTVRVDVPHYLWRLARSEGGPRLALTAVLLAGLATAAMAVVIAVRRRAGRNRPYTAVPRVPSRVNGAGAK